MQSTMRNLNKHVVPSFRRPEESLSACSSQYSSHTVVPVPHRQTACTVGRHNTMRETPLRPPALQSTVIPVPVRCRDDAPSASRLSLHHHHIRVQERTKASNAMRSSVVDGRLRIHKNNKERSEKIFSQQRVFWFLIF